MVFCFSRKVIAIGLTLILIGAPIAPAVAQEQRVAEIVVTGNDNINRDAILHAVELKPGDPAAPEAVTSARRSIEAMGYFSAVGSRTEETPEGVRVVFDVVENPVIREISLVGHEPLSAERVLETMRLRSGQVLNTRTLEEDVDAIQRMYQDEGYIAIVTEDIQIDRDGVLLIPILVHRVESIEIVGNRKTQDHVFLREMRLGPGDYFNINTLREDVGRIWNLDILEDIQAPRPEPGSEIGRVRVVLPVTEKKTGQVSLGLGYSSRQRLVGRAEMTETNFRGRGHGLNLLWETGTTGGVGGSSSYEVGYFLPWLDSKHTSLSVSAYNKLLYRFTASALGGGTGLPAGTPRYTERHKGGSATISRPLTRVTRGFVTLRAENVETPAALVASQLIGIAEDGDVRSAGMRLVNDTRDFVRDPAAGGYNAVSLELGNVDGQRFELVDGITTAVPQSGGFQKIQMDVRRYFSKGGRKATPADKRRTVAVRAMGGLGGGTMPFFEQFFVGGAETLRGYREDRFWGEKMLILSAEYRMPVAQSLTGVVFADYGAAWGTNRRLADDSLEQHDSFKPQLGTGIGLRVVTPIGNLRLDYGIGSEGARTHFSIGHAF